MTGHSKPIDLGKSYVSQKKSLKVVDEYSLGTGRMFAMLGFRQVKVKVVLFQSIGHGFPQNDAMPIFYPDT